MELFVGGGFAFLLRVSFGGGAWRCVGSASSRCLVGFSLFKVVIFLQCGITVAVLRSLLFLSAS